MKRFFSVALALLLFAAIAPAQSPDIAAKVDEYIAAQMQVNQFSGAVLIAREGKVLVRKGYGMANREWEVPNTPLTKFRLGSITKQFTSAAILLLEERGKLTTEDSICKYLEPCPAPWQPVTIHHLLTHTSGIPSYTGLPNYMRTSGHARTKEEMVALFRDLPLEFAPGERFKYNNSGYFLLGIIIEKISGQDYAAFLRANIFDPLEMKDSGYDVTATVLPRRAAGYTRRDNVILNSDYIDMGQPYSAGSLYSTVDDLYKWDQALEARKLLSAKSYEKWWTPYKDNYAYGWAIGAGARQSQSHGGGIPGFSTDIARFPEQKATVVVLANLASAGASRIGRDLAAILFGDPYEIPRERVVAKVDPKIYDAYVGNYQLRPGFVIAVTREGDKLMTQATNQPKFEVFPESETKFFLRVVDAQLTFVKDAATGKVTHIILHQGGGNQRANRID